MSEPPVPRRRRRVSRGPTRLGPGEEALTSLPAAAGPRTPRPRPAAEPVTARREPAGDVIPGRAPADTDDTAREDTAQEDLLQRERPPHWS